MIYHQSHGLVLHHGDVLACLRELADESVQMCVTSPPYYSLRDYGVDGQIGLEATPDEYVCRLVEVFREVRRVLKDDGTLWLNIGDSYAGSGVHLASHANPGLSKAGEREGFSREKDYGAKDSHRSNGGYRGGVLPDGLKPKDLIGIPWMLAFALRADGWWLRSDIIWSKPNPMPESVTDRPTRAHEYLFLLSKSRRYYYDAAAIREPHSPESLARYGRNSSYDGDSPYAMKQGPSGHGVPKTDKQRGHSRRHAGFNDRWDAMSKEEQAAGGANKRSVWEVATHPYPEAHFATFPEKLVEPCVLAGSKEGDTVLDPFIGSGTSAWVARRLGRHAIGIDLNASYLDLAIERNRQGALL